ncbi:MAG: vitamin K epoxide reductase family protein [Terriglobia bacterium]
MNLIQYDGRKAAELSRELRQASTGSMRRRRGVVALSLTCIASMGVIALYQMGVLKHVPEPPLPGLDADKVNGSAQAYKYLSAPDAVLGLGSYAATLGLAAMGAPDRDARQPWIPLTLAAKAGFDALLSAKLTLDQVTKYRAFCLWCLLAAGATFASVPLVLPEARAAARQLLKKKSDGPRQIRN